MSERTATEETLTPPQAELLRTTNLAVVTTLMADGSPHTTQVWVDTDGERLLFNTAHGRIKTRNLQRDPRISVHVMDCADPRNRWLTVRGRAQLLDEGADDHIDRLAHKYLGQERYPWRQPSERRVTVVVHAEKVTSPL